MGKYKTHGNCKAHVYLYKVIVNGVIKFLKLGSSIDIEQRKKQMQSHEFGIGKWKLVAKKKVTYWWKKEANLHRKCGFGMMKVFKKNGKESNECYEPEMKQFMKDLIKQLN